MGVGSDVRNEVCNFKFWKAVRTEFLGSLLLIFFTCGCAIPFRCHSSVGASCAPAGEDAAAAASTLSVAIGYGLAVATLTQCIGHISGAHMNPAVTFAMLATRNMSVARALLYACGQIVGGLSGCGILFGIARHQLFSNCSSSSGTFLPSPAAGSTAAQAFGMEFMATFIYVFTTFANLEPRRMDMGSRSLSIGFSVTLAHLAASRISGGALNPIVSLGPMLITGRWQQQWVYWAGPMLGAAIGGFTYEYTQDTRSELQHFRRSFRSGGLQAARSGSSVTELTFAHSATFDRLQLQALDS